MIFMRTGIVYDPIFLKHDQPGHPENSVRLVSVMKRLEENKLLQKVKQLESRVAETNEIAICHTQEYVQYVKEFSEKGGGYLDPDTYSNKYSFIAAAICCWKFH